MTKIQRFVNGHAILNLKTNLTNDLIPTNKQTKINTYIFKTKTKKLTNNSKQINKLIVNIRNKVGTWEIVMQF